MACVEWSWNDRFSSSRKIMDLFCLNPCWNWKSGKVGRVAQAYTNVEAFSFQGLVKTHCKSFCLSLVCVRACVRAWVRVPLSRWMIMYALWAVYHFTYSACDIFGQFIILGTEKVDLLTKSSYWSLSLLLKVSPCIKKKNLEFVPIDAMLWMTH